MEALREAEKQRIKFLKMVGYPERISHWLKDVTAYQRMEYDYLMDCESLALFVELRFAGKKPKGFRDADDARFSFGRLPDRVRKFRVYSDKVRLLDSYEDW
ncbi:hypothetical protein [Larkinella soli]|uniref:hypothetical protein n=1 Tax=Larkinella soli TaxID=1770527 RepID=UPI000FFC6B94|nr:hypothetical protein [Larkinella soli]